MSDTTIVNISQPPRQPVTVQVVDESPIVVVSVSQVALSPSSNSGDGLIEVIGEEITGVATDTLTLEHIPVSGKLKLFKNGVRLPTSQYSYGGINEEILLVIDSEVSDVFTADYKYEP